MKQAEWNDITWGSSSNQMAHISNFTISQKVKTEEQQAQNGENKVTIKGIDSEELTVSYIAGFPVGLDPRGEFDMFKKCVGMQDEFLLAGSPISDTRFELDEVELGMPFYAGWGCSNDRQKCSGRTNKRSLEEIFYIAYIMYSHYINPDKKCRCEIEEANNNYTQKLKTGFNQSFVFKLRKRKIFRIFIAPIVLIQKPSR